MPANPTRRAVLATLGSSAVVLGGSSAVAAHGDGGDGSQPTGQDEIAAVRRATAKYQDIDRARADGYTLESHCEENPNGEGAMGVHLLNMGLRGDGELDPTQPEVLLYEPTEQGYNLTGVEYMVNKADYEANHGSGATPSLFGQTFDGPMDPHLPQDQFPDAKVHYDLHVWCWKANPNGMFAPFNPNVSCPDSDHA